MLNTTAAEDLRTHLARFGLTSFRPGQEDVIRAVLEGQDCLCIMPTGGGKSLCYQLPAIARAGVTLVVSPLIALMKDQVDQLTAIGIPATYVNSSLTGAEQRERLSGMAAGHYELVYIAPERIRNPMFVDAVRETKVQLLAVDEAHCISEWGHDFRPDYARLGRLREKLGNPQTIALTATATPDVRRDVVELLRLAEPRIFISGFARPNLRFRVAQASGGRDKSDKLLSLIRRAGGPGIVYASTRKGCEEIAEELARELRTSVGLYHAGLMPDERREVQDRFMRGELPVIVATNAFGMGINKTDLRFVVHYNMPGTLEAYYQEAGRAGRDGQPAECLLLFSYSDRYIQEYFIDNNYPARETVAAVWDYLRAQREDPLEITLQELRERLDLGVGTEGISSSEQILEKAGALKRLDAQQNRASVWLESELPTLIDLLPREAKAQRTVLQAIERIVGDRRYERVTFQLERICAMTSLDRTQVSRALRELTKLDAFDYVPPFRGRAIHVLKRDLPFRKLDIDFAELEKRKAAEYEKLDRIVAYAQSRRCRQWEILEYFGDPDGRPCTTCDNCGGASPFDGPRPAAIKNESLVRAVRMALSAVARANGRFGKQVVAQMLAGSQSSKMRKFQLDQLSTFGLLSALKQQEIIELLDELQRRGLVQQSDVDRYRPIIQLTAAGTEVMKGTAPLPAPFVLPAALVAKLGGPRGAAEEDASGLAAGNDRPATPDQTALYDKLRRWRAEKADQQGVPHYRIVPTSVLEQLASYCPATCEQLLDIRGIGPATVERYGNELLLLVQAHRSPSAPPSEATLHEAEDLSEIEEIDTLADSLVADLEEALAAKDAAEGAANPCEPCDFTDAEMDSVATSAPGSVAAEPARDARNAERGEQRAGNVASLVAPATQGEPSSRASSAGQRPECYWTWRLLMAGFRPRECAAIRRLELDAIYQHAQQASERGLDMDLDALFTPEQRALLDEVNVDDASQVSDVARRADLPIAAVQTYFALAHLRGRSR